MNVSQLTYPTTTVISLQQAKDHLRVTTDDEDAIIFDCIKSATDFIEGYTGQYLLSRTFVAYLDEVQSYRTIEVWKYPVTEITAVKYINTSGVETTLATSSYTMDITDSPARVMITSVPQVKQFVYNPFRIYFTAGFDDVNEISPELIGWVKILTGFFYETRQTEMVGVQFAESSMNFERALDKYRKDPIL